MTETAADEQDLAKALDSVANAASGGDSSDTSTTTFSSIELPPIVPPNSPVAPSAYTAVPPAGATPSTLFSNSSDDAQPVGSTRVIEPLTAPSTDTSVGSDPIETNSDPVVTPPSDNNVAEPVTVTGPLADIKNDALNELRPLVDKLTVSPEEKFDTYLLLIRSTDDESLIAPAHEAAKAIEDEARRAEALLDIIKEIDYLSRPKTTEE